LSPYRPGDTFDMIQRLFLEFLANAIENDLRYVG